MEIEFYETASRNQPITEFIKFLKPAEQAKIARVLDLLEEFGTEPEDLTSDPPRFWRSLGIAGPIWGTGVPAGVFKRRKYCSDSTCFSKKDPKNPEIQAGYRHCPHE